MTEAVFITTKLCLDNLEDHELASMYMQLTLYPGSDLRNMPYYSRVSPLFQEEYDPPKMHEEVEKAFVAVTAARFDAPWTPHEW